MIYTINQRPKTGNYSKVKLTLAGLVLVAVTAIATTPAFVFAQGGAKTTVDVSACNNADTIVQYGASFPDGTIKARSNPNFVITGSSLCAAQFTVRLVSITTAYAYDFATNTYSLASTTGYPITEVSKDITVKPGVFKITNTLADKPADQVLQMRTEVKMYMSSSFDASGKLLPGAVQLATDTANWTQTNFVTF